MSRCAAADHLLTVTYGHSWRHGGAVRYHLRCWHCDFCLAEPVRRDAVARALLVWLLAAVACAAVTVAIVATVTASPAGDGQLLQGAGNDRNCHLERAATGGWAEVLRLACGDSQGVGGHR